MIRELITTDRPAYEEAQREAFGFPASLPVGFDLDAGWPLALGAEEGGLLAGKLAAYPLTLHLGGRPLAANGIADVTVAPEHRGRGLGRQLMREILHRERTRGVVASLLYPSVPAVYRSYGYATVATRELIRLSPLALLRARPAPGVAVERVSGDAFAAAYAALIGRIDGAVTPLPPPASDQTSLVFTRAGAVVAVLRTARRGSLVVCDLLLARDEEAWQTCLALLATETGADPIHVWSTPHDPVWHWYPAGVEVVGRANPMLRLLNVASALEARGWPPVSGAWEFAVEDRLLPENSGAYRLELDGGEPHVQRVAGAPCPPSPVGHIAALVAGVRRGGQPQWLPLPDELVAAAALSDWTLLTGF
ncbi:GNAT family N-acetyltransferase [Tessaracoccus sp. MC1865]|uniref:GNAT family N-acetyltransferase n=1 Tax=Tessaracoccus sp. MC1865 TaxID=2760310 RepID=UPI0016027B78|nr:GNAT family N-acetyltransferase [Tessaracoccus sp. MC1865]MBB1482382.1 GNAT family N-acetyltransferase [Tessaracoccus sp. MC1865]QTO38154.1 GNAT family N-acetyltransferase [Tessaracoccus sp. MC1865]